MHTYTNAQQLFSWPLEWWKEQQDVFNISHIFSEFYQCAAENPEIFIDAQMNLINNYGLLCLRFQEALRNQSAMETKVIEPEKEDKRFKAEDWRANPWFDFLKQTYLLMCQSVMDVFERLPQKNERLMQQAAFFTKQFLDAVAPSNFPWTNPEVIKTTIETQGQNFLKGFANAQADLLRGKGVWTIQMTDFSAFEVGKNIAATPGKVVFENRLLQLIQYTPTTPHVFETPLLIISPWINKYYNLDLSPNNSFVNWLVGQGHTVFMVSWVNPDASMADMTFEDYLNEGALTAIDAVMQATEQPKINVIGYCIGGTLLSTALSYLATQKKDVIKSATYLTSLIDFCDPGDIRVFIDEGFISDLETRMQMDGVLNGRLLALSFNLLRANDLIWSFYVNQYLQGKDAMPFDLLYWNSDSTNMPRDMHSFYLRNMYLENKLCQPGGIILNDTPIDIQNIKVPVFSIAAEKDHIAPWKSVYKGAQLHQGPVTFVLGGSGHIAGVVNPPAQNKYGFRVGEKLVHSADEWYEDSTQHPGSWWTFWQEWVTPYAGKSIAPRTPGEGKLKVIEDAPGRYVKERL